MHVPQVFILHVGSGAKNKVALVDVITGLVVGVNGECR